MCASGAYFCAARHWIPSSIGPLDGRIRRHVDSRMNPTIQIVELVYCSRQLTKVMLDDKRIHHYSSHISCVQPSRTSRVLIKVRPVPWNTRSHDPTVLHLISRPLLSQPAPETVVIAATAALKWNTRGTITVSHSEPPAGGACPPLKEHTPKCQR